MLRTPTRSNKMTRCSSICNSSSEVNNSKPQKNANVLLSSLIRKKTHLNKSLCLISSPERVRTNILKSNRIKKQLFAFTSSLKSSMIEDSLAEKIKPQVNFNKLSLNFDVKFITSCSPTRKYVEKGNIISRIQYQQAKNKLKPSNASFYENQRKNSIEAFAKGLAMGRYKGLFK